MPSRSREPSEALISTYITAAQTAHGLRYHARVVNNITGLITTATGSTSSEARERARLRSFSTEAREVRRSKGRRP